MKLSDSQSMTTQSDSFNAAGLGRSPQRQLWPWALLTVLLFGGGGIAWWLMGRGRSPQPMMGFGPVPVELMELESEVVAEQSGFVGVLDAQQGVVLKPEMDGQVVQIFVRSGDAVSAGDPIIKLSPDRSQAEVNAAIANTSVTQAALTNAQAQVRSAEAERVRAQADVALQDEEIKRIQFLVEEGAESQQQLDVAIRNRDGAIAILDAASEQVQAAQAAVQQAEAALRQSQSQVSVVQADLADTLITAPINGVVGDVGIKLGDYVEIGDELTAITQNQTLDLSLAVPVDYRSRLRLGLPVAILPPAAPDPGLQGRISFISPQTNATTQTIEVEATFDNATGLLTDDQRVEAAIIWQERPGVVVPANAVSRLAGKTFVFVATPSTNEETGEAQLLAQQRAVTLGPIQGNTYQVIEGVEPGESIVVSGILNLSNGVAIAPVDATNTDETNTGNGIDTPDTQEGAE